MKKILYGIGIAAVFIAGLLLARWYYNEEQLAQKNVQAVVLLEKVKKVCKLVTVEGNFVEHYDETSIKPLTLYLPFPATFTFEKTAFLEVHGNVMVGYDMEKVSITADSTNHILTLRNLPEAEILSIDHELKYNQLEESFFNGFSPEDYTLLNKNAKEMLRKKALESKLIDEAREQGNQLLGVIIYMAESVGWTVEIENDIIPVTPQDTFPN